jgi:hypothetical protein
MRATRLTFFRVARHVVLAAQIILDPQHLPRTARVCVAAGILDAVDDSP